MNPKRSFHVGVNYWPAQHGLSFWRHWEEEAVADDLAKMRDAGLDSVRIFLTWEDFQPRPDAIDAPLLVRLVKTLDAAGHAGLEVIPTLFTGHMSGANLLPAWATNMTRGNGRFRTLTGGRVTAATPLNWYTDPTIVAAQARLASACATSVAGHPALRAWDLGNENSNCTVPGSKERALSWLRTITDSIRERDPKTPITIGIHMEDLEEDRNLGPAEAARACDFLTMHGYPGYASFAQGPTDERLLPFLAQLTRFLGGGMDVLFSEFGVPTLPPPSQGSAAPQSSPKEGPALVSEEDAAGYVHRGLRALQDCGASGAMIWCYSDYLPALFSQAPFDRAPHERTFGMYRADGSAKPVVDETRAFSRPKPAVSATARVAESSFIDLTVEDYYDSPRRHLARLFRRYCNVLGPDPYGD